MKRALLSLVVLSWGSNALPQEAAGGGPVRIVTPEVTQEILANPGMGWQTFHVPRREDRNLPAWIPSTVQYVRWGWGELEPLPGQINAAFIDGVLTESRASGQKLAFRVMCCSTTANEPYHPSWLSEVGGKVLSCNYEGEGPYPIPDLDDPVVLTRHLDFIRRLGQRYDGHPDVDHVDLGSVGWWGEWHLSGSQNCSLPTLETRKRIIDAYVAAFPKTPLVMPIDQGECLKYAIERGTGWRADCLGDLGMFSKNWSHMRVEYPESLRAGDALEAWKTAPVAWETCADIRKWVAKGWPLRYIFNYALALHPSYLNNKSAPLPEGSDVQAELERFLQRLGYRLVLEELQYPAEVSAGGALRLAMQWRNTGSAPCYRPYRLAYRLQDASGHTVVLVGQTTVNRWHPGSIEVFTREFMEEPGDLPPGPVEAVSEILTLPKNLPAGSYVLSLAVVAEESTTPVVQLGIKGRTEDGWYPLSRVQVKRF